MAVGADQSEILRHFAWKGAVLLGIGLIAGLVFALGMAKTMASLLFNVNPHDPWVFGSALAVMTITAVSACLLPAWRAARTDPARVLRE